MRDQCGSSGDQFLRGDTWDLTLHSLIHNQRTNIAEPNDLSGYTSHRWMLRFGSADGAEVLDTDNSSGDAVITPVTALFTVSSPAAIGATSISIDPAPASMLAELREGADVTPVALNFTGVRVVLEQDVSEGDTTLMVRSLVAPLIVGATAPTGVARLEVKASATRLLEAAPHAWDWQGSAGARVKTLLAGRIDVVKDVTR
jgi:hypothetical protein